MILDETMHVIKVPRDIMGRSPTWNVGQYSAKFGGHRHCGSGDVMVLFVM